jgi:hypothetical protein
MFSTRNFNHSKPILFILILFPSLLWAYQFVTGNLGVNPIEKLMDELGLMALRLIIITLMITTLSNIKSIKSIVEIRFLDSQPETSWETLAPWEYGFYANVNPNVNHPRWSQGTERRIGEFKRRETLMFNGYEKEVAHLYKDLDLTKFY